MGALPRRPDDEIPYSVQKKRPKKPNGMTEREFNEWLDKQDEASVGEGVSSESP